MTAVRPQNLFGPVLGLAEARYVAGPVPGHRWWPLARSSSWPPHVADPGHGVGDAGRILADLHDPILAPFVAMAAIPAMILATALAMVAFAAGRVAAVIFPAVTIAGGGAHRPVDRRRHRAERRVSRLLSRPRWPTA
jgi:hypothetical protein